jgi:hypothetical protein
VARELRTFWASLPQHHDDRHNGGGIVKVCDELLKSLDQNKPVTGEK